MLVAMLDDVQSEICPGMLVVVVLGSEVDPEMLVGDVVVVLSEVWAKHVFGSEVWAVMFVEVGYGKLVWVVVLES